MGEPFDRRSTIAIMSPGDMGAAVAQRLIAAGFTTITCLVGRSKRTGDLAQAAGIETVDSLEVLVDRADLLLSILVPSSAMALAEAVASVAAQRARHLIFVECNAVAPATVQKIGARLLPLGVQMVDGGIIGPPPRRSRDQTRFYLSGDGCDALAELLAPALDARALGGAVGDASAVKMCYAAQTKGMAAVGIQAMIAAERLGVRRHLEDEMRISRARELESLQHWIPSAVPKAFRWIGEMEEIAATLDAEAITPLGFEGAAETYRQIAAHPLGRMRVEDWQKAGMSFDEVVTELAQSPANNK